MKKKFIAISLALTLVVSAFTGCGGKTEQDNQPAPSEAETETPAAETDSSAEEETNNEEKTDGITLDTFSGTELTIAVLREPQDQTKSYNEKPAIKMAEEATGIHINWIELERGTESEKVNIMLTADMPDAILGLVSEQQIASDMELFYDLSEEGLLETYAPKVLSDIEGEAGGIDLIKWPDGSIRSLVTGSASAGTEEVEGVMVINKHWLENVGKEMPTTADEFYDVLCAFRDQDANGNGDASDEIPFSFCQAMWAGKIMNLAGPFGIAGSGSDDSQAYIMVKNGKVEATVNTDEYRAFLEYYNKLVKDGLMDVESFSETTEQYNSKIAEEKIGVFMTWAPTEEDLGDYVTLPPFKALDGVDPLKSGRKDKFQGNRTGLVISANCENVEALLHWWNFLSSTTEMKILCSSGEQGYAWDNDGEGNFVAANNIPEGYETLNDYTRTTTIANVSYPLICAYEAFPMDEVGEVPQSRGEFRVQAWEATHSYLQDEYIPVRYADADKLNERSFIEMELFDAIGSFRADAIMNGVTDESWAAYLEQLESLQLEDWVAWYQDFYDGKF